MREVAIPWAHHALSSCGVTEGGVRGSTCSRHAVWGEGRKDKCGFAIELSEANVKLMVEQFGLQSLYDSLRAVHVFDTK